jgi:hypothetical protein
MDVYLSFVPLRKRPSVIMDCDPTKTWHQWLPAFFSVAQVGVESLNRRQLVVVVVSMRTNNNECVEG